MLKKTPLAPVWACLVFSLSLLFAQQSGQQQQRQRPPRPLHVSGRVLPAPGESTLPQMMIVTLRADGSAWEDTKMITPDGKFEFRNAPHANYQVILESEGYQTVVTELHERDSTGGTRYLSLNLGPRLSSGAGTPPGDPVVSARHFNIPDKALKEVDRASEEQRKGKLDKAIEHLEKAIKIHPEFPDAYINMGAIHLRMGARNKAESAFLKSIELDPTNDTAYKNLGFIYLTTGREDESIAYLRKAVELDPADVNAQAFLGEAFYQTDQFEEAVTPLQEAMELNPEMYRACYRLGYVFLELKRYPEALASFQNFLKTNQGMDTTQVEDLVRQLKAALEN